MWHSHSWLCSYDLDISKPKRSPRTDGIRNVECGGLAAAFTV